jgi:hypothetical protein
MKHNFREQPSGGEADAFLAWLERETIDLLLRTRGDAEGTKTAIFLFVNRAFEAHMPEQEIGALFGKCFVRAGRPQEDEAPAFELLEFLGEMAGRIHNRP